MKTSARRSRTRAGIVALAAAIGLTGCGFSPYELPLPGGADLGDEPYEVRVAFRDALDLVPQSAVRVNDVSVGKVTKVRLKGWTAEVTLQVNKNTELPDNTQATIRQTSLLGEKFVNLAPPTEGATGRLSDGDVIPLERSGRNPEIEEVFSAASLLLNGGGIEKTNTIVKELGNTLEGNEPEVKELLKTSNEFLGQLDDNKQSLIVALEKVNRLAIATNKQKSAITNALDDLPGGPQRHQQPARRPRDAPGVARSSGRRRHRRHPPLEVRHPQGPQRPRADPEGARERRRQSRRGVPHRAVLPVLRRHRGQQRRPGDGELHLRTAAPGRHWRRSLPALRDQAERAGRRVLRRLRQPRHQPLPEPPADDRTDRRASSPSGAPRYLPPVCSNLPPLPTLAAAEQSDAKAAPNPLRGAARSGRRPPGWRHPALNDDAESSDAPSGEEQAPQVVCKITGMCRTPAASLARAQESDVGRILVGPAVAR